MNLLRWLVRKLDAALRRGLGIREFSDASDCLLRLGLGSSPREVTLSDGTHIRPGEPIGEIHFWNEHMPPIPEGGADLAWARRFSRYLTASFRELARYIEKAPRYRQVRAFRGVDSFGSWYGLEQMARIYARWGFDMFPQPRPTGLWGRLARFWEHAYATALIWAYDPHALKDGRLKDWRRDEIWISRRTLLDKYAPEGERLPPQLEERSRALR
ncbi:MAG: hypothetical protein H5T69_00020 [Chloroflexi bacterium]|nr:hypothetical protein [Chloroflexota bacterium]